MPNTDTPDVARIAKDAFYVTVGLGVMAFQRAQVRRRDLQERLNSRFGDMPKLVEERLKTIEERLEATEAHIDAALDRFEARLPGNARSASRQVRTAAKDARGQLHHLPVSRAAG